MTLSSKERFPRRILDDSEFSFLMMDEFDATQASRRILPRTLFRAQFAALSAGFVFFLFQAPPQTAGLAEEFSTHTAFSETQPAMPAGRSKSGGASVLALPASAPALNVEFLNGTESVGGSAREQSPSGKTIFLDIQTGGIRQLRAEVHVNGRLSSVRQFDLLVEPLEESQSATVDGKVWGYVVPSDSNILICLKPVGAPMSPVRLSTDEMVQRAQQYPERCFFSMRK